MYRREFIAVCAASMLLPAAALAGRARDRKQSRSSVAVDPRIELIGVVQLLAGYFLMTQANITYKDQARAYFAAFEDHAIVKLVRQMTDKSFSFDRVPDTMLRLTDPVELAWRTDLRAEMPAGLPEPAERAAFLAALRDFAQVSNFRFFFRDHRSLYQRVCRQIEPVVAPNVRALQAYVGASLGQWHVIPGLLMHDGGFAVHLTRRDGMPETYALLGPEGNVAGDPKFGDEARLQDLVVHEFAHTVVNPLAQQQPEVVALYKPKFENLRAAMKKEGYDDWPTVVNEHVVRAVTARIAARNSEEAGRRAISSELEHGFMYVPNLVEVLRTYESDRVRWPNLGSYYPLLLKAFDRDM